MHIQKKGLAMVERARGWRIERKIPIGLIVALLAQAGAIVWWAAAKEQQDHYRDARLAQSETLAGRYEATQQVVAERLARLEARLEAQTELLRRIDGRMERR